MASVGDGFFREVHVGRQGSSERGGRLLTTVWLVAACTAFVGWLILHGGRADQTWAESLVSALNMPFSFSVVSVVLLSLTATALARRKRLGLWTVVAFQVFGIAASTEDLLTPDAEGAGAGQLAWWTWLDVFSIVVGVVACWWLWRLRPAFRARIRPGSWVLATVAGLTGLAVTVGVTVAILWGLGLTAVDSSALLLAVVADGFGYSDALAGAIGRVPPWVPGLTSILTALSIVAASVVFLRTARDPHAWSGRHELAIRRLVRDHGEDDSLAYFATRRDRSAILTPGDRAVVSYRVVNGVALAAGDPIGDPHAWQEAIGRWRAEAREHGWSPAVLSASESGARAYAHAGFQVRAMGDEAVLEASRFTLEGPAMADVRHAVRAAEASGLHVQLRRQAQLSPAERREIAVAARSWLHGESERGFSMALNREMDPADGRILYVTAHEADGSLAGVLGFVPWGRRGVSLDVMRRRPDAPHGVTELMVCELMRRGPEVSVARVSLNFCMFRSVFAESAKLGSGGLTKLNGSVLGFLDRFWQLERLYRSNRRYRPRWVPRYVCYDAAFLLPKTILAMGSAEGFLPQGPLARRRARDRSLSPLDLAAVAELDAAAPALTLPSVRRTDGERVRLRHLAELTDAGGDGYPAAGEPPTATLAELACGQASGAQTVSAVGRVARVRDHGGVVFVDLIDGAARVQALAERAGLGAEALDRLARWADRGDLVEVTGRWGASRTGTPSLLLTAWRLQAKCLRPLPEASWGDPEGRARRRSDDLVVHPAAAEVLRTRTAIVRAVRRLLDERGFLEVETPVLHAVHGGATARPFVTHVNAYDLDVSLRIAPELYLKRLVVGGMGPLYEISRNFRNEGVDATHNPEFTSLEAYQPYADYTAMRLLTEDLVRAAAVAASGRPTLTLRSGEQIDLSGPFAVVSVTDAVSAAVGRPVSLSDPLDDLVRLALDHGIEVGDGLGAGGVLEELYGELVEPRTTAPTFYTDFPLETSPLTRPHRTAPGHVERWDLVVDGMELGTAYTELTDPLDQRRRLTEQSLRAAEGDPEAMEVDEDFLAALELGMPPTGGLGIGLDRLVMLLTGQPIRGVLAFPFVRPGGSRELA